MLDEIMPLKHLTSAISSVIFHYRGVSLQFLAELSVFLFCCFHSNLCYSVSCYMWLNVT